jgi:hypothetical protein
MGSSWDFGMCRAWARAATSHGAVRPGVSWVGKNGGAEDGWRRMEETPRLRFGHLRPHWADCAARAVALAVVANVLSAAVTFATGGSCSFTQVSAGDDHTCGLRRDRTVGCWGLNHHGQSRGQFHAGERGWGTHLRAQARRKRGVLGIAGFSDAGGVPRGRRWRRGRLAGRLGTAILQPPALGRCQSGRLQPVRGARRSLQLKCVRSCHCTWTWPQRATHRTWETDFSWDDEVAFFGGLLGRR